MRREALRVSLLFAALTLLATYPLWVRPAETMLAADADAGLVLWILSWDAHAFLHQPLAIFDANIYYPFRNTLAFAENLIGTAFVSSPVLWITGSPVLALNAALLLSCVLCGVGAWLLARRVGLGPAASVIAGLIFAFSPPRFFRIEQIHLAAVQWVPFGLATLHAYLDRGRPRDLKLTALFFTLQVLSSGHGAVFMLVACGGLLAYRVALGEPLKPWRRLRDLGVTGVVLLAPVVWSIVPYMRAQQGQGLRRSLDNWTVPATSFLAAPTHVQTWLVGLVPDARVLETAGAFLFPGFLTLILAAAALVLRPARAAGTAAGAPNATVGRGCSPRVPGGAEAPPCEPADVPTPAVGPDREAPPLGLAGVGSRNTRTVWLGRGAVALEILALALVVIATLLTAYRPGRVRVGDVVLFSARSLWRPWLFAALAVAARIALLRVAPFDTPARLRRRAGAWLAVCLAATLAAWRRWLPVWHRWRLALRPSPVAFYGLLTLLTILLTIGPPLGLWPLVYWLPGLSFIRVPSRFTILGMLGLAVLAGFGFERLRARLRPAHQGAAALAVGALLVLEFLAVPLEVSPYRIEIPAIDRWLAAQPGRFAIAEVPLPSPADQGPFERRQTAFMLHATAHWQRTVHGYSGIRARLHDELFQHLREFPTEEGLRRLSDLGVSRIVVHTELYEPGDWPAVEARIAAFPARLRLERVEGAGRVYSLHPPGRQ